MITGYGWIQRNDWIEFAWLTLTFGLEASQHLGRDTIALEGRDKHDGLTTHYIPNQKSSIRPMFDSILPKNASRRSDRIENRHDHSNDEMNRSSRFHLMARRRLVFHLDWARLERWRGRIFRLRDTDFPIDWRFIDWWDDLHDRMTDE